MLLKPYTMHNTWQNLWLKLIILLVALGCQRDKRRDLREFYFPLRQLTAGLVYEYESLVPGTPVAYWYLRSLLEPNGQYLTTTIYRPDFSPQQHAREQLVSNGMLLEDFYLYEEDTLSKRQLTVKGKIVAGNVFPFQVSNPPGVLLVRLEWNSQADPGAHYTVIRNRRFAGDTTVVVEGKKVPAIKFALKEAFEYDQNGVLAPPPYGGLEVYAQGIGLVFFRKTIGLGQELAYRLKRRYPMEELEKKFRQRLQGQ